MLAGLFDEDAALAEEGGGGGQGGQQGIPRPLPPRNRTKLCGLSNLGATCYMNALLQTLFYTPELRESLFSLSREELGIEGEAGMIRDIPVQLQHLFARMLLADQDTVGVEGLVSSFGWTNNEQMQQHDVQELNRILFDAIESSLVGTSGEQLIAQLYHGTSVQQVICGRCENVSEREEDFLDIPVALTGRGDLESALKEMFCDVEVLEGSNQYRCGTCNCLVDAKRAAKLRKLPPVLTFNLLRFLYDFEKGERYKDLSSFKFPRSLIMKPYLEAVRPGNPQKGGGEDEEFIYDLFSVVIHSGTTHSGHYVAFIRDIDRLGVWTQPEKEPVSLQKSLSADVLEYNSPLELLQAIIPQCGGKATINKLCKLLQDQTGVTWNKRFKQQYGPISKFIRQNSDVFSIDSTNTITLKSEAPPTSPKKDSEEAMQVLSSKECTPHKLEENEGEVSDKDVTPVKNDVPVSNGLWFEFNDSHVLSVNPSAIDKMFSGRQSAYMLFYRLRSLKRPNEAAGNPVYGVPQWLQDEVATTNAVLEADRQHYEKAVNTVNLSIHPSVYYVYASGALQNIMNDLIHVISFDRRQSVSQLQATIIQEISDFCTLPDTMCINVAKKLPAGLHVYECISNDENSSLIDIGISNNADLFVWNGTTVNDDAIPLGKDLEPILLHLNYPADSDGTLATISNGFPKSTTILELRQYFVELLNCSSPHDIHLNQVQRSTRSGDATIQTIPIHKDKNTLADLSLSDGDHLTAELKTKKGYKSFAYSVADKQNKMITFLIENRCVDSGVEDYPVYPVEVSKTEQLHQVKRHITSQLQLDNIEGGGCLCIEDDFEGLGPSLAEEQSVSEAGIESGMRVVLKPGLAPLRNQIPLKCAVPGGNFQEVIVDRSSTIKEVCSVMVAKVGLEGDEWHLRKCNWAGESAETVDDEAATVNELKFRSGEYFLIESGRLPPKGFLRLSVHLYTMDNRRTGEDVPLSVQDWFQGPTEGTGDEQMEVTVEESLIPLHEQIPSHYFPQVYGQLDFIGNIEINKECSVKDLKEQIMCLSELSLIDIPSSDFLRVRDLLNKRPGRVFKDKTHSLKRLKLVSGSSICCQVLPEEENLPATSILFNLYMRRLPSQSYSKPIEVVYDTAVSTTPIGLYSHISHILAMPLDRIVLAKHKFESFQWIRIEGHTLNGEDKEKKGKRKGRGGGATGVARASGKGGTHVNIKNAPISLRDGDHVAVKDLQFDPADEDDFLTPEDKKGKAILAAIQEEKRRRRKAKSEGDILSGDTSSRNKKQRRPEIGIKIHVPDFSASLSEKPS
ncbi:PREDICTED: ubiquitin carboxyl-terminal hydrolase 40-like [Amphimedon queenslandica]|uniref:USP domain-containing protein n=1 Tax=Amphimedon queenslandica TaxID=400682 RepID=A0A1X7VQS9_AMPQE|nr:PREDICTED: ubiquitin carboxyl-terminal hydrolase 40-like [Amphimedon queenslandica]XP_019857570.1 PREDICTED: ubiquitin carboxyl-terminal hydrolase 40-like [Amphimedon queenslandica]|eukprot:XP_019857565.1 PREDICTED: ubiquitin carboxyl-terminal hydrolase 40-like [Amphimedon queenslandica]